MSNYKKYQKSFEIIILLLTLSSCEELFDPFGPGSAVRQKNTDPNVDVIILNGAVSTNSDNWTIVPDPENKGNFNISTYQNVDSIIFKTSVRSQYSNEHCVVELYNLTDDNSIPSSTVFSRVRYILHSVRSRNLKDSFPKKNIKFVVRIRSSHSGNYVELGQQSSLLIYYH